MLCAVHIFSKFDNQNNQDLKKRSHTVKKILFLCKLSLTDFL